jgi:hypothetical protein
MITTNETFPWSFVTQIFRNGELGHGSFLQPSVQEILIGTKLSGLLYILYRQVLMQC